MTNEPTEKQKLEAELEEAKHDAWVAQVMLSTVLDTVGAVTVTKDAAARDLTGMGIEVSETEDGESLILQLKAKQEVVTDDESE